ncbi:hypothetical protein [Haloechinothrix alba]|uniref:hypothetical protein n=1 Tax=Haloechinothrix alba TaxID=664784 RepID=UPI000B78530D|nr:hypothetical protein [Haloechinothrix alba]
MAQLSFFSAEASAPCVADLAGVLCGHGQIVSFADTAARLSVVTDDEPWRAGALAEEFAERGIEAEITSSDGGYPLVRTAFRADLLAVAQAWSRGAVKAVPAGFMLDGAALRLWMLACGRRAERGYQLQLDPRAEETHEPLLRRVSAAGLVSASGSANLLGPRAGGPAVRIVGVKRMRRLAELAGRAPVGAEAQWPAESRAVAAS